MSENGTLQNIRDLFSQGFNAAEIIAQGYAPSTAYRVQRDSRLKLELNGNSAYHKGSTSYGFKHLGNLGADNRQLRQRLDSVEKRLAGIVEDSDAGPLWDRLEVLSGTWKS